MSATIDRTTRLLYLYKDFIRFCGGGGSLISTDGCLMFRGNMQTGYSLPSMRMPESCVLLCTQGEVSIILNGQERTVLPHSLFVYPPNGVLRMQCSETSTFICIIPTLVHLMKYYNWAQMFPLIAHMENNPVLQLTETDISNCEHIMSCMLDCRQDTLQSEWSQDALSSGMRMLLCTILNKLSVFTGYDKTRKGTYKNRAEEHFFRFIELLSAHHKQERRVEYYASCLYVTPKHLSTVVKKISGKTPSKWIEDMVMEEIRHQLRHSNSSVKEIAYQMNFPNCSFFGKYVKKFTGLSPQRFRTI